MASALQTTIQQLASATVPTFPQNSDAHKLNQITEAFSRQPISDAFTNLNNQINAFLNSPKPNSSPGDAPTATAEQTNSNSSTPSFSRK